MQARPVGVLEKEPSRRARPAQLGHRWSPEYETALAEFSHASPLRPYQKRSHRAFSQPLPPQLTGPTPRTESLLTGRNSGGEFLKRSTECGTAPSSHISKEPSRHHRPKQSCAHAPARLSCPSACTAPFAGACAARIIEIEAQNSCASTKKTLFREVGTRASSPAGAGRLHQNQRDRHRTD